MEGKIVYQGKSKNGTQIIIRYPEATDASSMTDYINTLSEERTFITYQGEKENLESESKYLNTQLEKIRNKKAVQLLTYTRNTLIGISSIELGAKTSRHVGLLGISVEKGFRGEGIGKLLIEYIMKEAIENFPELEIITLGVFANNAFAIRWYKKLGFVEEGRLPKGVKLENGYTDHIYMYKRVN